MSDDNTEDPFHPLEVALGEIADNFFEAAEKEDIKKLKKVIKSLTDYKKQINALQNELKKLLVVPSVETVKEEEEVKKEEEEVKKENENVKREDNVQEDNGAVLPPIDKRRGKPKA